MARLFTKASSDKIALTLPDYTTLLSVAGWINPTTVPPAGGVVNNTIISKGRSATAGDRNFGIDIRSVSSVPVVEAFWTQPVSTFIEYYGTSGLSAGAWGHFCFTFDWTTNPDAITLYVNGTSVALTRVGSNNATPTVTATQVARIGALHSDTDYFNGIIAELGVWPAVLTATEAAALAKGTRPPTLGRPMDLYVPLWGVASPEADLSGNARNGTVTGATAANHAPTARG